VYLVIFYVSPIKSGMMKGVEILSLEGWREVEDMNKLFLRW
jgi:hypothetical protein